jgi:hypothetical protein
VDILDGLVIGTSLSRRFATLLAVVTVVCFLLWPTQSFNFVHGQALDSIAGTTKVVGSRWGVHCDVAHEHLLEPATITCTSTP